MAWPVPRAATRGRSGLVLIGAGKELRCRYCTRGLSCCRGIYVGHRSPSESTFPGVTDWKWCARRWQVVESVALANGCVRRRQLVESATSHKAGITSGGLLPLPQTRPVLTPSHLHQRVCGGLGTPLNLDILIALAKNILHVFEGLLLGPDNLPKGFRKLRQSYLHSLLALDRREPFFPQSLVHLIISHPLRKTSPRWNLGPLASGVAFQAGPTMKWSGVENRFSKSTIAAGVARGARQTPGGNLRRMFDIQYMDSYRTSSSGRLGTLVAIGFLRVRLSMLMLNTGRRRQAIRYRI